MGSRLAFDNALFSQEAYRRLHDALPEDLWIALLVLLQILQIGSTKGAAKAAHVKIDVLLP